MAIQIGWYGSERVIYCKAVGEIHIDDIQFITDKIREMDQPSITMHSFNDVRSVTSIPHSLREMIDIVKTSRNNQVHRTGWVIIAGSSNRLLQFLLTTLSQIFGFKLRMLPTIEEGLHFLQEMDDHLPPLLPFDENAIHVLYSNLGQLTPKPEH